MNIQWQVDELHKQVGRIAFHPALASTSTTAEDAVVQTAATTSNGNPGQHGPIGHGEIGNNRGLAYGVVTTQLPPPVKGMSLIGPESPPPYALDLFERTKEIEHQPSHSNWSLPSWIFRHLTGIIHGSRKLGVKNTLMCMGFSRTVQVATLHFAGNAA